ncbi:hypothetical protein E2F43_14425 [Seongchinamella unica]|uniref:Uncharacterized protein n=1 Tax=Seongchinamella unica TaxID=2547392 RepID=A0A4R5LQF0_9GAMM|nr:rhamnan synthesis F family protein [Seongchinamella unica]TDG12760.1 hypothetical protein E2F43_14425 [Seongchinamella unica]
MLQMKTACVFAHYDRDGIVDSHVTYSLSELHRCVQRLVFVSTSNLSDETVGKLVAMGIEVIVRKNRGYDFYSYKVGIEHLTLSDYDQLILCNDSVYGPLTDLSAFIGKMNEIDGDFWGITESFDFAHHLQSYFLVFKRTVLNSSAFAEFWSSLDLIDDKNEIIRRYEVGLSQVLTSCGFKFYSVMPLEDRGTVDRIWHARREYGRTLKRRWRDPAFWSDVGSLLTGRLDVGVNHSHLDWEVLLIEHGSPYIKVELLRDNPKDVRNLEPVLDVVRSKGEYPVELISKHLARVGGSGPLSPN